MTEPTLFESVAKAAAVVEEKSAAYVPLANAAREAGRARDEARKALDAAQGQFNLLVNQMAREAPEGSRWAVAQ